MTQNSNPPNPQLSAATTLCLCSYVDDPNLPAGPGPSAPGGAGVSGGASNIQAAVQHCLPDYRVVWSCQETPDYNYAFIAQTPDNDFFLVMRGSLPFEVGGKPVIDWGVLYNWFKEDFNVFGQRSWPYGCNGGTPYIADGAMDAFGDIQNGVDVMGSGLTAYKFLLKNAVQAGHPVYITGHSLGGNIADTYASYFAYMLEENSQSNAGNYLFTFAAPAAGSDDFVSDLQIKFPPGQSYHYEIDNDIVPKFPVFSSVFNVVAQLFSPAPSAGDVSVTLEGHSVSLSFMIRSMATAIWLSTQSPYAQTPATPADHALSPDYTTNDFYDWFMQAAFQHQIQHYIEIFAPGGAGAKVMALAPSITRFRSVYRVPDQRA